ncbi:protein of unknown function [Shewanella benthica]|uniref:Uncharacterized protein n=1 Tax=Shewanella benthica TaxID=43661 RepID=A0A330M247_9GAMM|nr:protein of unknown function [Shewanella benthica]
MASSNSGLGFQVRLEKNKPIAGDNDSKLTDSVPEFERKSSVRPLRKAPFKRRIVR